MKELIQVMEVLKAMEINPDNLNLTFSEGVFITHRVKQAIRDAIRQIEIDRQSTGV